MGSQKFQKHRLMLASGLAITLAALIAAPATATAATAGHDPSVTVSSDNAALSASATSAGSAEAYWTPERMNQEVEANMPTGTVAASTQQRSASAATPTANEPTKDIDLAHPQEATARSAPAVTARAAIAASKLPITSGKLWFTNKQNQASWCTGSIVNTKSKSLVMTAGHCVYPGDGSGAFKDIYFTPGWNHDRDGGFPKYGITGFAKKVAAPANWKSSGKLADDQAVVSFQDPNYKAGDPTLVSYYGGDGIRIPGSLDGNYDRTVELWGYPGEGPYAANAGNAPVGCKATSRRVSFISGDMAIPCNLTGGASGGPWLEDRSGNVGYIIAVTSRVDSRTSPTENYAYRNGQMTTDLINSIDAFVS